MPFRKHPTYVRKARNGYQLQRGVPKDVQPVIGKTIWVEAAGSTYRVAQRLSPAFAAKTDRLIAEARNEVLLTGEELIDSLPQRFDLKDFEIVDLLLEGSDVAVEEGLITPQQESRYRAVLRGEEPPRQHLSKDELIQHAKALKSPAARTEMSWKSALDGFLEHAGVTHPTAATSNTPLLIAPGCWNASILQLSKRNSLFWAVFGQFFVSCDLIPRMSFED